MLFSYSNTFLTDSYIVSGIYPYDNYDFDIFLYKDPKSIIYIDY